MSLRLESGIFFLIVQRIGNHKIPVDEFRFVGGRLPAPIWTQGGHGLKTALLNDADHRSSNSPPVLLMLKVGWGFGSFTNHAWLIP